MTSPLQPLWREQEHAEIIYKGNRQRVRILSINRTPHDLTFCVVELEGGRELAWWSNRLYRISAGVRPPQPAHSDANVGS